MVSDILYLWLKDGLCKRLNPCCSGIWSRTSLCPTAIIHDRVLILVVVEYGLGHLSATVSRDMKVLILVVVEYGLGHIPLSTDASVGSLNPCCSGIWSRTT